MSDLEAGTVSGGGTKEPTRTDAVEMRALGGLEAREWRCYRLDRQAELEAAGSAAGVAMGDYRRACPRPVVAVD